MLANIVRQRQRQQQQQQLLLLVLLVLLVLLELLLLLLLLLELLLLLLLLLLLKRLLLLQLLVPVLLLVTPNAIHHYLGARLEFKSWAANRQLDHKASFNLPLIPSHLLTSTSPWSRSQPVPNKRLESALDHKQDTKIPANPQQNIFYKYSMWPVFILWHRSTTNQWRQRYLCGTRWIFQSMGCASKPLSVSHL